MARTRPPPWAPVAPTTAMILELDISVLREEQATYTETPSTCIGVEATKGCA